MKLLVIIATVVACTCAISTEGLQHPSPVNPDVLVAVKPKEKIVLITDPKEIAKFKRETKQPLYPTVLPKDNEFYITKPVYKKTKTLLEASADVNNPLQKSHSYLNTRNRRNVESYQNPTKSTIITSGGFQKSQNIAERNVQEVIKSENNGNEEISKANTKAIHQEKIDEKHVALEVIHKPQGLSALLSSLQQEVKIPVTVLKQFPKESSESNKKFTTLEESLKGSNKKDSTEEKYQNDKHSSSEVYQKTRELPISFSPSKRDIPVPLIAKYHHPEESPKENTRKEFHEDHIKDQVTTERLQKPQTLPLVVKEIVQETDAQHKRDIPVPLVPKHHQDINKKEQDVLNQEDGHFSKVEQQKPQPLAAVLKETRDFSQQQKRETLIPLVSIQKDKENFKVKSENHHDSEIHHISQTPIYNDNISQEGKDDQKLSVEELHKPQNPPTHNQENIVPTNALKPQTLPTKQEDLKVSASNKFAESAHQQLHPVGDHYHSETSQKESHHDEKEVTKSNAEQHHNQHHVEDILLQKPIYHTAPIQENNKPNVLNEHLSITDLTTSTTEQPIIRHRPVPVAELFSRAHSN